MRSKRKGEYARALGVYKPFLSFSSSSTPSSRLHTSSAVERALLPLSRIIHYFLLQLLLCELPFSSSSASSSRVLLLSVFLARRTRLFCSLLESRSRLFYSFMQARGLSSLMLDYEALCCACARNKKRLARRLLPRILRARLFFFSFLFAEDVIKYNCLSRLCLLDRDVERDFQIYVPKQLSAYIFIG